MCDLAVVVFEMSNVLWYFLSVCTYSSIHTYIHMHVCSIYVRTYVCNVCAYVHTHVYVCTYVGMYALLAVFELEDVQFVHENDQGKPLLLKLNALSIIQSMTGHPHILLRHFLPALSAKFLECYSNLGFLY